MNVRTPSIRGFSFVRLWGNRALASVGLPDVGSAVGRPSELQALTEPARRTARAHGVIAMLLVATAIMLGGGGSPDPLPEIAVQLAGLAALAAWALVSARPTPDAPARAWLLGALLVVLPLLQLIPLPPAIWHDLPGREVERAALALVEAEGEWRPWSVDPARTLASLLALTTPVILLLMVSSLGQPGRAMVIAMIAAVSTFSLILGAAQLAGGAGGSLRFYVSEASYLAGFQANRNSTADVLLIGMIGGVSAGREWVRRRKADLPRPFVLLSAGVFVAVMTVGVVLTTSRAGIILLPVAWLAIAFILRPWLALNRGSLKWALPGIAAAVAGAGALAAWSGTVRRVAARFRFEGEFRPELWRDALFAAKQFLPIGSGTGTFVPVFIASERLEVVDPSIPNRAHNEVLEILVESGVPGMVVAGAIALLLVRAAIAGLRHPAQGSEAQTYFAVGALVVIAIHSQVDYPLRSMSLACIAAAAAGLLISRDGALNRDKSDS